MRDRSDRRYDLKQRRTSEEAVEAVGEQLASADWAADAVIEADGRTRSRKLGFEQADGRLMARPRLRLRVAGRAAVAAAGEVAGSLGQAAVACALGAALKPY